LENSPLINTHRPLVNIFKNNKAFFICISVYVLVGFFILIFVPKGEIEKAINSYHNIYLDQFFLFITEIGNGAFLMLVVLLLFFKKIYYGLLSGICFITSTIFVQTVKRFAFPDSPRPLRFFEPNIPLHYVDGLEIHSYFSFPSGHTSGAFTMFCILAILVKNKYWDIVFFLLAFVVGFSRMYLLQHFFADTYFGAIFGITATLLVYYILQYRSNLSTNTRLDRPIYEIFKPAR
jgi:membrane-associated phospholipid phosphatase